MAARPILGALIAISLMAPFAAAAKAEDYAWTTVKRPKQNPSRASLIYGSTEDTDTVTFFLFCDTSQKATELDIGAESQRGRRG